MTALAFNAGHAHYVPVGRDGEAEIFMHALHFPSRHHHHISPTVVLVHGWPDCAYSWRAQVPALTAAGFGVVCVDLPGFGLSSCPRKVDAYTYENLCTYLSAVLDHLRVERAAFLGHDWGGMVVWHMAWRRPDRCCAVAALCTPWRPPTRQPLSPAAVARKLPFFQYQAYFQTAAAEEEFNRDPARSVLLMLHPPGTDGVARAIGTQMRIAGLPVLVGDGGSADGAERRVHGVFDRVPPSVATDALGGAHTSDADRLEYATAFRRTGFGPGSLLVGKVCKSLLSVHAFNH